MKQPFNPIFAGFLIVPLTLILGFFSAPLGNDGAGNWGGGPFFAMLIAFIILPPIFSSLFGLFCFFKMNEKRIFSGFIAFILSLFTTYLTIALIFATIFHLMRHSSAS